MRHKVAKHQRQRAFASVGPRRRKAAFSGRSSCPGNATARALDETRARRWKNLRLLTCKERRNCPHKGIHRPIVQFWGYHMSHRRNLLAAAALSLATLAPAGFA